MSFTISRRDLLKVGALVPLRTLRVVKSPDQDNDREVMQSKTTTLTLEGTTPLELPQDILKRQFEQISEYFLKQIAATPAKRDKVWRPDYSSSDAYRSSLQRHRHRLREMLGLIVPVAGKPEIEVLAEEGGVRVESVKIPLDGEFCAGALVFLPLGTGQGGAVIAIPPENQSREEFAGLAREQMEANWLTILLGHRVTVAIPSMAERRADHILCTKANGQDRRRILWRAGFIVGRTLTGLEVQTVLALRGFLASRPEMSNQRIAVLGKSQGGMTALYSAAADERFAGAVVLDYFQRREECWRGPIDRTLYGQLNEFGDAEVAALIAPRPLTAITAVGGPVTWESVETEITRARRFYEGLGIANELTALEVADHDTLKEGALRVGAILDAKKGTPPTLTIHIPDDRIETSRNAHFEMLYSYLRSLGEESEKARAAYWKLDSILPSERPQKVAVLRSELAILVGAVSSDGTSLNPRTALVGETQKFLAFDVLLDTVAGVEAYGQLLVPRAAAGNMESSLPAVICQHGFDGAPKYVTGVGTGIELYDHFYHRFGQRLAERGYVVFAPYLTVPEDHTPPGVVHRGDLVTQLVRQAACLGMMRTSIELAKLHRIVDFLQSLRFVDSQRIGYYGLSYGGYSAIWMGPLESRLKLIIISGYYNDRKLNLTDEDYFPNCWSLPDEDFYTWNLLNRFTDTELIAAMWPRSVCIEYGLGDPVTPTEWHRGAWQDIMKKFIVPWDMNDGVVDEVFIGPRTGRIVFPRPQAKSAIEFFIGPHTIHGIGTFFFLDRWLRPERSAGRDYGCDDGNYCLKLIAPSFHGYAEPSQAVPDYVTQLLDSNPDMLIRGRFYVSNLSPLLIGMALKASRVGHPGDLIIRLGSREGAADIGEARIAAREIHQADALFYEAKLKRSILLDPRKLYFFEITADSARSPADCYMIYGVRPLGGRDFPSNFSLAFRMLTHGKR